MGTPRFTPEFKEEAVRQITERGYSIAEVSERLPVAAHTPYKMRSQTGTGFTGCQNRNSQAESTA